MVLTDQLITQIGLYGVLPAFIVFLFFIMWDISKQSQSGLFGKVMVFVVLGAGFMSFIIKEIIVYFMHHNLGS